MYTKKKKQSSKRCKHEHTHLKSLAVRNWCQKETASSTNYSKKTSCPQVEEWNKAHVAEELISNGNLRHWNL